MKKKRMIKATILGFVLIGALSYGEYIADNRGDELDKYGAITEAEIVQVYYLPKRGNYVRYKYEVGGEEYSDSQEYFKSSEPKVGQLYKMIYSTKTPKFSRILFD